MKDTLNDEIISVIMAAISMMQARPGYRFVVKSFRRIPQTAPVWSATGRYERLKNKI